MSPSFARSSTVTMWCARRASPAQLCLGFALSLLLPPALVSAQSAVPPRYEGRITMSRDVSFTLMPPWQLVGTRRDWVNEMQIADAGGLLVARAVITRENQKTAERARQRLLVTAGPVEREGEVLLFRGWPAYRISTTDRQRDRRGQPTETRYRHHVLAVAAGATFVSVDLADYANDANTERAVSQLMDSVTVPDAPDATANARHVEIIRDRRTRAWDEVNPIKLPVSLDDEVPILRDRGFRPAVRVVPGLGELEISASTSGKQVVIGTNAGYANSTDFGQTFTRGAGTTPFPIATRGDPSTGYGVTGAFYLAYLGTPVGGAAGAAAFNGCTVPVAAATDGGTTWRYRGDARQCTSAVSGTSNCFPDQEHIAADSRNAVRRRVPGGRTARTDQVYAIWREFSATTGTGAPTTCTGISNATANVAQVARASCSRDGGRTWTTAPAAVSTAAGFDFAKITVGLDGRVHTVAALAKTDGWTELWVDQFSACSEGFARQPGFPHVVGWLKTPTCVPGLDRCTNLSSPTIAVSRDFGNLVWIGASFPSNDKTDRVIVALSSDGGSSFFGWKEISDNVPGRKFMPWVCVSGRHLYAIVPVLVCKDIQAAHDVLVDAFGFSVGEVRARGRCRRARRAGPCSWRRHRFSAGRSAL